MTLVATCPHCKTSFRVVADQLKLRRGLVRCGRCQQVFSGVDALTYLDDSTTPVAASPPVAAPAPSPAPVPAHVPRPDRASELTDDTPPTSVGAPVHTPESFEVPEPATGQEPADRPADRPADWPAGEPESAHGLEPAVGSAPGRELDPTVTPAPVRELEPADPPPTLSVPDSSTGPLPARPPIPGEATEDERPLEAKSRPRSRVLLTALIVLALLGASAQSLLGWRHELAFRWPAIKPLVSRVCEQIGLDLHPPRDARSLTIESFEVVAADSPMKLSLEAVIRNRSARAVAYPSIELTLRDSQSVMLTRRVIAAADYVSSDQQARGIPAQSEWTVNVLLEHDGLAVAGYSAVLFHP